MSLKLRCIFIFLVISLTSCGKYEDGPDFSLRTKKQRLTGTWIVVETIPKQQGFQEGDYIIDLEKDGDATLELNMQLPDSLQIPQGFNF